MRAKITFIELSGIYFASKFWGMLSPMRSGEIVPALLRNGQEAQHGKLLSIILYDRVLETFQSLIIYIALFFLLYGVFFGIRVGFALVVIFVLFGLLTFVLISEKMGKRVIDWIDEVLVLINKYRITRNLRNFFQRIKSEMEEFYKATKSYFTIGFSLYNLFLTFFGWFLDMLLWIILFKAMAINTGLLIIVTSVMVYSLMSVLTPIPGGIGVSDLSFALILGHFGYTGEVGGLIILSRIILTGYIFIGYAFFNIINTKMLRFRKWA